MFLWMLLLSVVPGDDWKMIAYDRQRTARTPAVGQIQKPRLAWQLDTAVHDTYVAAGPSTGSDSLGLAGIGELTALSHEERLRWGMASPRLDVVGNGEFVDPPSAPGARWGKFLPDVPGLQRLSWTTTWGEGAHFQMHSFEAGVKQSRRVWDVPFEGAMYSPLVVVTDLDGDGRLEAVLSMWHGVVAYDIATGEETARCMYREGHGRQYGFFGAYTDPNGRVYLVVIGDFAGHIGVLAWRDGQIEALWSHLFDPQSEQGIDRRYTINTLGPDPIGDFDGDGHGEVLMNVFNEAGDGRWHLLAYDLDTGEHRLDLPDVYLYGHVDLDGDGIPELLAQRCPSRPVATNGELRIHRWDEPVWAHQHARWSMHALPELPLTHISGATKGMNAPVTMPSDDHSTVFFTSHDDGETLYALCLSKDNQATFPWRVGTPANTVLDAVASSGDDVLLRCRAERDMGAAMTSQGTRLSAIARERVVHGVPQPLYAAMGLPSIPQELLAHANGGGILKVGTTCLYYVPELSGFLIEDIL